jgi:glycosyltransferase involved in cell wall biosynthesis
MQNRTTLTTFFTQLYYPDMTTTAIIMADLAEDLASFGQDVNVVCAQATYLINEQSPKSEVHNRVGIKRVWTFLFNKNKNIGRILNSTSCFLSMFPKLFHGNRNDLLVFNTNPALLPILGLFANKLKKQKYVVLIHDLWPELPTQVGMISRNGFIYRLIDYANTLALRNASAVVVISETIKNLVLRKAPEKRCKVHVLPYWADRNRSYSVPHVMVGFWKSLLAI